MPEKYHRRSFKFYLRIHGITWALFKLKGRGQNESHCINLNYFQSTSHIIHRKILAKLLILYAVICKACSQAYSICMPCCKFWICQRRVVIVLQSFCSWAYSYCTTSWPEDVCIYTLCKVLRVVYSRGWPPTFSQPAWRRRHTTPTSWHWPSARYSVNAPDHKTILT